MAFLPTFAWQQKGFNDEQDKARRLRSENRKSLQEISDRAAQEGREIDVDEWFNIVNQEMGSDGFLNNYAPANIVLESMRKSSNVKAQQVQRDQAFTAKKRETEEDNMISSNVLQMTREGKSSAEIVANIGALYGQDMASRYAPKIDGIIQQAVVEDNTKGAQIGAQFDTVEAAQAYVDKMPSLTGSLRESILSAARRKEEQMLDENDKEYRTAISKLPGYGYADTEEMRAVIANLLPRRMNVSPEARSRHVDEAMKIWKGISQGQQRITQATLENTFNTNVAGTVPEVLRTDRELSVVRERMEQNAREAVNKSPEEFVRAHAEIVKNVFAGKPPKNQKEAEARQMAISFLSENEVLNPEAIISAAADGAEAVTKAIDKARITAVPLASAARRIRREAALRTGVEFVGDATQDYDYAIRSGEVDGIPALLNNAAQVKVVLDAHRGELRPPVMAKVNAVATRIARNFARTRELLAASGRFEASAERMQQLENEAIWRHTQTWAQAVGFDKDMGARVYAMTLNELGLPSGIERRTTPLEANRAQSNDLFRGAGLRPLFGAQPGMPQGYRPPSDPNAPF
jgi:hypothetical protein